MHIHVKSPDGEAKIWIEPEIELERAVGYNEPQVNEILEQVEKHRNEIEDHWRKHFS